MKRHRMMFFAEDDGAGGAGGASSGGSEATLISGSGGSGDPGQQQQSSAPVGWTKDDGSFADGWADRLPEDLKDALPTASRYKTLPDMVKALHHANQALGKRGAAVPTEKSTPEEVAAYRVALGVPDSPDGYKLKPEKLPDGMTWNEDLAKPFAEIAHRHNIPPAAMAELVQTHLAHQQAAMAAAGDMINERLEAGMAMLKDTWKADTDKHIAQAARVAKTIGLDPLSPGLTDPNVVIALHRVGSMLSEDTLVRSDSPATMMSGKNRANEIMTNPSDPLYADYHGKNGTERQQQAAKMVGDLLSHG